jgi:hypothetical protein
MGKFFGYFATSITRILPAPDDIAPTPSATKVVAKEESSDVAPPDFTPSPAVAKPKAKPRKRKPAAKKKS